MVGVFRDQEMAAMIPGTRGSLPWVPPKGHPEVLRATHSAGRLGLCQARLFRFAWVP